MSANSVARFAVCLCVCLCGVAGTRAVECDASGVCTTGRVQTVADGGKQMWARSCVFTDAPPLEVSKWLSGKPETEGKFVIIEFWRTWCGACKRMTPLMNTLHRKFGDELVVIGITGETEEQVKAYVGPKKEYALALDRALPAARKEKLDKAGSPVSRQPAGSEAGPDLADFSVNAHPDQGAYEALFGVWGWPHVIILEPQYRTIIWEGFPGLKGYELTEAKVAKILAIGRGQDKDAKSKK
ncbi:MAG: redoxin domain-containing protein [Kiritimatiellae bacterium]|nr:redoxin domain-containing protein [Kiritimatiellia bacterium]NLG02011.1 redoxin domain-containing protein [Lentisphaerota bacterium]